MASSWSGLTRPELDEESVCLRGHNTVVQHLAGQEELAAFLAVDPRGHLQLRADGGDLAVVDVQVGGPRPWPAPGAGEPTEHLVEEERQGAAVRGAIPAEVKPGEGDRAADRHVVPLSDVERRNQGLSTAGQVESPSRHLVTLAHGERLKQGGGGRRRGGGLPRGAAG